MVEENEISKELKFKIVTPSGQWAADWMAVKQINFAGLCDTGASNSAIS